VNDAVVPRVDLALALPARWESVPDARAATLRVLEAAFHRGAPDEYVGMIVSELLENAVRYGDWARLDEGARTMRLGVHGDAATLVVEVESPSSPARTETLARTLAWMATFPTPRHAYEARVLDLADDAAPPEVSRLGLVRIAAEGRCEIEAELDPSMILHVRAIVRPGRKP
jgi:hypothetical protein